MKAETMPVAAESEPTAVDYAVYHSQAIFTAEQENIFR